MHFLSYFSLFRDSSAEICNAKPFLLLSVSAQFSFCQVCIYTHILLQKLVSNSNISFMISNWKLVGENKQLTFYVFLSLLLGDRGNFFACGMNTPIYLNIQFFSTKYLDIRILKCSPVNKNVIGYLNNYCSIFKYFYKWSLYHSVKLNMKQNMGRQFIQKVKSCLFELFI